MLHLYISSLLGNVLEDPANRALEEKLSPPTWCASQRA